MIPGLYCFCYKENINLLSRYNQKNLMLGSISYDTQLRTKLRQNGFLFDDLGINISHLNSIFGSLTGLYWVWKNTNHELVGIHTYRLYWNFNTDEHFEPNTIYVPEQIQLLQNDNFSRFNVLDQYVYCHGNRNFEIFFNLVKKNKTPIKEHMLECIQTDNFLIPFNMFICERKTFNDICTILFGLFFEMYDQNREIILYEDGILRYRTFDFFAERILHIIFRHINYFFPDVKLKHVPLINIEREEIKEEQKFKI